MMSVAATSAAAAMILMRRRSEPQIPVKHTPNPMQVIASKHVYTDMSNLPKEEILQKTAERVILELLFKEQTLPSFKGVKYEVSIRALNADSL